MIKRVLEKLMSFFFAPVSLIPLGFFRISIGLIALFLLIQLWPHLLSLYGNFGFIQWAIIETSTDTWFPSIGKLYLLVEPYRVSPEVCVYTIFSIYGLALIGFVFGVGVRICAFLVWLCHISMVNSGFTSIYGLDTMLQVCFFYALWMPLGQSLTIFHFLKKKKKCQSVLSSLSIRVLQLHMCVIYLNTSIAKMSGAQWWNGEAIWRALMQPQFSTFAYDWLSNWPFVPKLLGWLVLIIEFGYIFFIWIPQTKKFWLISVVLLHAGIAIFMGLPLFSLIMIVMNITAFGWSVGSGFFVNYQKYVYKFRKVSFQYKG